MSKIRKLLLKLSESLQSVSNMSCSTIESSFNRKLLEFGLSNISVECHISDLQQIFVKFSDRDGDDVVVYFCCDDSDNLQATVVSTDDKLVQISFSQYKVVKNEDGLINLNDLSWMNKSSLIALLNAGKVNEEFSLLGNKMIRLPTIKILNIEELDPSLIEYVKTIKWKS